MGVHVDSFTSGLRAALRENPDVLLVGEMRDPETIRLTLTAAQTGHLVLSTLHAGTAVMAIERVIDAFRDSEKQHVRQELAASLRQVVSQQLLPGARGGRVPVLEMLAVSHAVAAQIRDGRTHMLATQMEIGGEGMVPLERTLAELVRGRTDHPRHRHVRHPQPRSAAEVDRRPLRGCRRAGGGVQRSGRGMNSTSSPGILAKRPFLQSSLARSMRSRELETKFHQTCRSPSSGAPPTSITRVGLAASSVDGRAGRGAPPCARRRSARPSQLDRALDDVDGALLVLDLDGQRARRPPAARATYSVGDRRRTGERAP